MAEKVISSTGCYWSSYRNRTFSFPFPFLKIHILSEFQSILVLMKVKDWWCWLELNLALDGFPYAHISTNAPHHQLAGTSGLPSSASAPSCLAAPAPRLLQHGGPHTSPSLPSCAVWICWLLVRWRYWAEVAALRDRCVRINLTELAGDNMGQGRTGKGDMLFPPHSSSNSSGLIPKSDWALTRLVALFPALSFRSSVLLWG